MELSAILNFQDTLATALVDAFIERAVDHDEAVSKGLAITIQESSMLGKERLCPRHLLRSM